LYSESPISAGPVSGEKVNDRVQDGDFDCDGTPVPVVDMGYDEVPEPDCDP
jgi:hypothetical protein